MPGFVIGALLAVCNVVFIAHALEWTEPAIHAPWVMTFGIVPGIIAGLVVGCIATATARLPLWARYLLLAGPAVWTVFILAASFEMMEYFFHASIPTAVCVALLERATRLRPEPPVAPASALR